MIFCLPDFLHFTYKTSILEIPFAYRTLIPESSKNIKDNSGIAHNVGVQEKL